MYLFKGSELYQELTDFNGKDGKRKRTEGNHRVVVKEKER